MKMNILTLQGSARKTGNTVKVLEWVEEELTVLGHTVTRIYLHGRHLNGCMGCGQCKKVPDAAGCVQKDDIPEILDHMVSSDLVIFASPLYFWGVSAQIKAVIDRTYSLYTKYHDRTTRHCLKAGARPFWSPGPATGTTTRKPRLPLSAG
jgi:multimeric flavodoxin WrbA